MFRYLFAVGFSLACFLPLSSAAAPVVYAEPSELAPHSEVKVELRVTIDSPDLLALDADIRTAGATTFKSLRILPNVPPGSFGKLIDPQRTRPRVGDTVNRLPASTFAFAELVVRTGDPGDQILIVSSTVVNSKFCGLVLANEGEAIATVVEGGATAPTTPTPPPPSTRPIPVPIPAPAPAPAPTPSSDSSLSIWLGVGVLVIGLGVVAFLVLRRSS